MTIDLAVLDFTRLPSVQRVMIAQDLLDSVVLGPPSGELTAAQRAELRERARQVREGECEPWEAVRARLWEAR